VVGGLEHGWIMTFHMLGIIIPTDELIFFRGVGIPPTSFVRGCMAIVYPTEKIVLDSWHDDTCLI